MHLYDSPLLFECICDAHLWCVSEKNWAKASTDVTHTVAWRTMTMVFSSVIELGLMGTSSNIRIPVTLISAIFSRFEITLCLPACEKVIMTLDLTYTSFVSRSQLLTCPLSSHPFIVSSETIAFANRSLIVFLYSDVFCDFPISVCWSH